jgi:hypothetical protein
MSQEEIEALMNGLDIVEDEPTEEVSSSTTVNTDEIEELISQNEELTVEKASEIVSESIAEEIVANKEELDVSDQLINNDDIEALLKNLENKDESENVSEFNESEDEIISSFDDELADIDGIVESTVTTEKIVDTEPTVEIKIPTLKVATKEETALAHEEIGKDWADSRINEGIFPLPANHEAKVVNQLNEVANDSEEKVGQIFDILSISLDNNTIVRDKVSEIEEFINSELELLNSLSNKFPNIDVFSIQKDKMNKISSDLKGMVSLVNSEDEKIFEAMELMQFNDINRQKIERVMAVIRKLSSYLNNIFEDTNPGAEVSVAKHIHGDKNSDLIGEDLDKLIEEYQQ